MLISKNKKWLYMSDTLVSLDKGFSYDINNIHPSVVCDFLKEQTLFEYNLGTNDNLEILSKIKKLVYPLIDFNSEIVLEYEIKYGMKLISEITNDSFFSLETLISESWDFVKNKLTEIYPDFTKKFLNEQEKNVFQRTWDQTKKIAGSTISSLKQATSYVLNQGLPWFFEKLEKFLINPATIAADVALSTLGIGKVASAILWGSLGIWKLYQLSSGKIPNNWFSYFDIASCFLGLMLTGAVVKPIMNFLKANRGNKLSIIMKSPIMAPLLKLTSIGASGIKKLILQPIKWLTDTFGLKSISGVVQRAQNSIDDFVKRLNDYTKGTTGKIKGAINRDITNPVRQLSNTPGQTIAAAGLKGVQFGAGVGAISAGIDRYAQYKDEKQKQQQQQLLNPDMMNAVGSTMTDEWAAAGLYD